MTSRIWSFERPAELSPPLKRGVVLPSFGAFAAFNHDGSLVLTANEKGRAVVWKAGTDGPATEEFQHRGRISHAEFTRDGKRVVLATGLLQPQGQFSVWDLSQAPPSQIGESVRVSWPITEVKLTPDEKHVLVAGGTAQQMSASGARVFELDTLAEVGSPHIQFLQVLQADISPDGTLYATAGPDGNVFVRELLTGTLVQRLIHSLNTQTVRFSPDGKRVVTTSDDSAVVWDLASGKRIGSALGHGEMVNYAEFSPDGESLATASADQTARIWVWDSDADDWAHPQRIEQQVQGMLDNPSWQISTGYMVRIRETGYFSHFSKMGKTSPDGALRIASISSFFRADFLRNVVGHWDSGTLAHLAWSMFEYRDIAWSIAFGGYHAPMVLRKVVSEGTGQGG